MNQVEREIEQAVEDYEDEHDSAMLAGAIERGDLPAGTTLDDLTPQQQVDHLGRDPEDVGL